MLPRLTALLCPGVLAILLFCYSDAEFVGAALGRPRNRVCAFARCDGVCRAATPQVRCWDTYVFARPYAPFTSNPQLLFHLSAGTRWRSFREVTTSSSILTPWSWSRGNYRNASMRRRASSGGFDRRFTQVYGGDPQRKSGGRLLPHTSRCSFS